MFFYPTYKPGMIDFFDLLYLLGEIPTKETVWGFSVDEEAPEPLCVSSDIFPAGEYFIRRSECSEAVTFVVDGGHIICFSKGHKNLTDGEWLTERPEVVEVSPCSVPFENFKGLLYQHRL